MKYRLIMCMILTVVFGCTKEQPKNSPKTDEQIFNEKLETIYEQISSTPIADLTPFPWTAVCIIPQYANIQELVQRYPFMKTSISPDINLEDQDKLYLQYNRPVFLFFDEKSNQYKLVKLSNKNVRNGMPWYLEVNLSKRRQQDYLSLLPDSVYIKDSCLLRDNNPKVKFVAIPVYPKPEYKEIVIHLFIERGK